MQPIHTIRWHDDKVVMIDQRKLPTQEIYVTYEDYMGVAEAIKTMVVRGAPAIGVAAAMGMALGACGIGVADFAGFMEKLRRIGDVLNATRPTAVNLRWAVLRMLHTANALRTTPIAQIVAQLKIEAQKIFDEDLATSEQMGLHGAVLLNDGDTVLTHCNAGALATAGGGTALAVIYAAARAGKKLYVIADETRPFLQGARLTAWELQKFGLPVTVITDNMAAWLMQQGKIQKIIVGADRIAANGDVANKIGTYGVAVLAQHHRIPFYVAAPRSTVDLQCPNGAAIPIEERDAREVTHINNQQLTPDGVTIFNPSFDVTPAHLITAIITEAGIAEAPYAQTIATMMG